MPPSGGFTCFGLSLLIFPPLFLVSYLFAAFPATPQPMLINPSLASLPDTHASWGVYPPDLYPGGNYVQLPYGQTRYWLMGPEKGQKLVLIHGLSIPSIIWRDVAPILASRGYRILLFDLYGRGYSDAPYTTYASTLYTTQLALLLQHLKWDRTQIAGMSMGGGITAAFVAQFPHLVENRVALIASAGLLQASDLSRTSRLVSAPIVQAIVSSKPARKFVQHLLKDSALNTTDSVEEIVRIQSAHLPGFNYALSSSLRDGPIRGQAQSFSSPQFKDRKVLFIHGTNDTTVNYKYAKMMQELLPPEAPSELVTIPDVGHELLFTRSNLIVEALDYFFSGGRVGTVSEYSFKKVKSL